MPQHVQQPRAARRAAATARRRVRVLRCRAAAPAPPPPPQQQQEGPPAGAAAGAAADVWPPPALPRTARLGVLGGGQLGRMLGLAAVPLGVRLSFLDPQPGAPAGAAAEQTVGSYLSAADVASFTAGCDALTVELEHVDAAALSAAQAASPGGRLRCAPAPGCVALLQDKLRQRRHFEAAAAVAQPRFEGPLRCAGDAEKAAASLGLPLVLKRRRGSYDGAGNAVCRALADLPACAAALGGYTAPPPPGEGGGGAANSSNGNGNEGGNQEGLLYAEEYLPLLCELAVMVARGADGSLAVYPLAETVQAGGVCSEVHVPPRWLAWGAAAGPGGAAAAAATASLAAAATALALRAVAALPGAGVFGVEMFAVGGTGDGVGAPSASVLLNEVAPRPHNSGHYTLDACECSQFEQQARCALGWPLGSAALTAGAASMLNVLGDPASGEAGTHRLFAAALGTPGAAAHWYGKAWRAGRKLGHVTVVGRDPAAVAARLAALRAAAAGGDAAAAAAAAGGAADADAAAAGLARAAAAAAVAAAAAAAPAPAPQPPAPAPARPLVGIIMGSDSDLGALGVPFEVTIVSAHRTPDRLAAYACAAAGRGLKVVIAGAGGAAHLPGMVASHTRLPVIGVPVPLRGGLAGVDSLLSIVQMPAGIPVATVGVGAAANAGLLAARVLALSDPRLAAALDAHAAALEAAVVAKAERLERLGWEAYLGGQQGGGA